MRDRTGRLPPEKAPKNNKEKWNKKEKRSSYSPRGRKFPETRIFIVPRAEVSGNDNNEPHNRADKQ